MKHFILAPALIAATINTAEASSCALDATSWLCEQEQMQKTGQANIFKPGSFMHQQVQRQRYGAQNYGTNIFEPGSVLYNHHENNVMQQFQQRQLPSQRHQQQMPGNCFNYQTSAGRMLGGLLGGALSPCQRAINGN